MNIECEQLRSDLSLEIAKDEVLSQKEMRFAVISALGERKCKEIAYKKTHKVIVYEKDDGSHLFLLVLAVSFMGGQHPIYRHRAQLKSWYKDFYEDNKTRKGYDTKIIGVYHYKGNIIFIDFEKETYLKNKMHNSAAWVYTNDLFQAMKQGSFKKTDKNGNVLYSIAFNKLKAFLNGTTLSNNDVLFEYIKNINENSNIFKGWIYIINAIKEMRENKWPEWRQTEWFGWYLEYQFNEFIRNHNLEKAIKYTGRSNKGAKKEGAFDFDLWFEKEKFYGDLKSSDITKRETPGNDQIAFLDCINKYDRFWYILYEAECIKTEMAACLRYNYLDSIGEQTQRNKDPDKHHRLLKEKVRFKKMSIIELNRINYREALVDFNQGRQPDGKVRNKKFSINKNNIDNFIVFSETEEDIVRRIKEISTYNTAYAAEKKLDYFEL